MAVLGGARPYLVSLPVNGAGVTAVDSVFRPADLRPDFSGILFDFFLPATSVYFRFPHKIYRNSMRLIGFE